MTKDRMVELVCWARFPNNYKNYK